MNLNLLSLSRLNGALVGLGFPANTDKAVSLERVENLIKDGVLTYESVKSAKPYEFESSSAPDKSVRKLESDIDKLYELLNANNLVVKNAVSEVRDLDDRLIVMHEDLVSKLGKTDGSTIRAEVSKLFDSFRESTPVETMKSIARSLPAPVVKKKACELFSGTLSYRIDGEEVDFSNMEVSYWGDDAPNKIDDYVFPPQHLHVALTSLENELPSNMWLGGERGTGKTEFVTQLANRLGRKLYRINFDEAMERAEFIGGNSIEGGDVVWKEGIVTQAIQHQGALILFDEISFARPQSLAVLHSVCEPNPNRSLTVAETGKRIPVAQDVAFFVADNSLGYGDSSGNFSGIRDMNTAFLDRFAYTLKFEYLDTVSETKLLMSRTGLPKEVASSLVKFANGAREKSKSGLLTQPPSIRQLFAWGKAIKSGLPISLAFNNAIVNKYPEDCEAELRGLYSAFIDVSSIKKYLGG